jgi:hypothetical protein
MVPRPQLLTHAHTAPGMLTHAHTALGVPVTSLVGRPYTLLPRIMQQPQQQQQQQRRSSPTNNGAYYRVARQGSSALPPLVMSCLLQQAATKLQRGMPCDESLRVRTGRAAPPMPQPQPPAQLTAGALHVGTAYATGAAPHGGGGGGAACASPVAQQVSLLRLAGGNLA